MSGGKRTFRPGFLGLWLAACLPAAASAKAADEGADGTQASDEKPSRDPRDIVVFGLRFDGSYEGVSPRDELSEDDIAAHGAKDVGEFLDDLTANLAGRGSPLVLVNGEPVNGIEDISALPTEALRKVQLLPPRIAMRYGARAGTPVVNVVVKQNFRQAALLGEGTLATAGGGRTLAGEASLTRAAKGRRFNLTLRAQRADMLREAQRGIISQTEGGLPFDPVGNVVAASGLAEIDPALSALAGRAIDLAAVPAGLSSPRLADFLPGAGRANAAALGAYTSLIPETERYSFSATWYGKLSTRSSVTAYARGNLVRTRTLNGLTGADLLLPAGSPFNPFAQPVVVARYLGDALRQDGRSTDLATGATLNTRLGKWRVTFTGSWQHRSGRTLTQRGIDTAALEAAVLTGRVSPFGTIDRALLADVLLDRAHSRSDRASLVAQANGDLFKLPAGAVTLSLRAGVLGDWSRSDWTVGPTAQAGRFGREEANLLANIELPVTSGALGSVTASLSGSLREVSRAATLPGFSYGLEWAPAETVSIEATVDHQRLPASVQVLSDPVVVREGVRVFDFLRNQTATVSYLSGGNPGIAPERRQTFTVDASWRVLPHGGLTLSARYTGVRRRDAQGALPPVSAEVQAAFPDRYQRDASGLLTLVDGRAVSFARSDSDEITWGFAMRRVLARQDGTAATVEDPGDEQDMASGTDRSALRRGVGAWRVSASLNHTVTLRSLRQARAGLPVVNLLDGGASGYGSGTSRHALQFAAGIAGAGVGLQLKGRWESASWVKAGSAAAPGDLHFGAQTRIDARLNADLGRIVPDKAWSRGLRLWVGVVNVLDSQQRVTNRLGQTPLSYQPYLLDPLGRTVTVTLRKAF